MTPSTSSYASASKSRTPVQVINKQYQEAKKRLSRTVDCARASIRRSIRTLQEPSSRRSVWRKGVIASGTKIPVYSGSMRTYPATEGKIRTLPKQEGSAAISESIKRRSARGRRSSHFGMGDMDQGCFLITPKVMRKLFATASNVASIVETDEASDEPIKVHSVKPSSLFKFLFSDSAKESSEAKLLVEGTTGCKLESVSEVKSETSVAQGQSTAEAAKQEPVKTEIPDSGAEKPLINEMTIKKSQSTYEMLSSQMTTNPVVDAPTVQVEQPATNAESTTEYCPVTSESHQSPEESQVSLEPSVVTSQPIIEPEHDKPAAEASEPVIEPTEELVTEKVADIQAVELTEPAPEPVESQIIESSPTPAIEATVNVINTEPIESIQPENAPLETNVTEPIEVEQTKEATKPALDSSINYQTVPESADADDQATPSQDVTLAKEEASCNNSSHSIKIVDESVAEEETQEAVSEETEKQVEKSVLDQTQLDDQCSAPSDEPAQAEETVYVEILSESIQCDFGDNSVITMATASSEPTEESEAILVTKIDECKSDPIDQDQGFQSITLFIDKCIRLVFMVIFFIVLATNLVDQLVQITQNVRLSLSRSPLKESSKINVTEEEPAVVLVDVTKDATVTKETAASLEPQVNHQQFIAALTSQIYDYFNPKHSTSFSNCPRWKKRT